jgi:hypothetical protein
MLISVKKMNLYMYSAVVKTVQVYYIPSSVMVVSSSNFEESYTRWQHEKR